MTKIGYFLLFAVLTVLTIGCSKNPTPNFHYEYFGLEEGRFVIYDVIEIQHDADINQHDTLRYQLKTYWADTFVDNEGRIAREFKRFVRPTATDPWVLQDTWTGLIHGNHAELVEENQRILKMVFAPTLAKSWNANAYNMNAEQLCSYRDIHRDTTINATFFDSTLVVEQASYNSIIDSVQRYDVYAKRVGLIYKFERDLHYQLNSSSQIYLNVGTERYYQFVATGIE